VVRNRSLKIAKIDQHDGIAAGFGIAAAILEIVSKSHKQARYGTEKNVSQMCGTKMNAHFVDSRAAAQAIAVASEAGQGQQPLAQQGRSAMTPPRPAAMDGAEPKKRFGPLTENALPALPPYRAGAGHVGSTTLTGPRSSVCSRFGVPQACI
jgi:hypothetical protein